MIINRDGKLSDASLLCQLADGRVSNLHKFAGHGSLAKLRQGIVLGDLLVVRQNKAGKQQQENHEIGLEAFHSVLDVI